MAKRQVTDERIYRERLWARVERLLKSRDETKTQLATRWGKPKSTVTRLSERDVPTTLENLDALAAAFDMELVDFLWPILKTADAAKAEARARSQFARQVNELFEAERERSLAGLQREESTRIFSAVAGIHLFSPGDLQLVADMLEGLTERRRQEAERRRQEALVRRLRELGQLPPEPASEE